MIRARRRCVLSTRRPDAKGPEASALVHARPEAGQSRREGAAQVCGGHADAAWRDALVRPQKD